MNLEALEKVKACLVFELFKGDEFISLKDLEDVKLNFGFIILLSLV